MSRTLFHSSTLRPRVCRGRAGLLAAWWLQMVVFGWGVSVASAQGAERMRFEVPTGTLAAALKIFSEQSGRQVIAAGDVVKGVQAPAISGEHSAAEALTLLLAGTALAAVEDRTSGAFAIVRRPSSVAAGGRTNAGAVIVIGLAVDAEQGARFRQQAERVRAALIASGVPAEQIMLVPANAGEVVRREAVVAALRGVKPGLEITGVLVLGNIAPGREGQPMLQVSGPRLSAEDFAAAVATLPGQRFVMIGASRSGGFLTPLLKVADVEAVAATAEAGELGEPRFTGFWVDALAANPHASFHELVTKAAAEVTAYYRSRSLAQTEHAQRLDRAAGQVVKVGEREK